MLTRIIHPACADLAEGLGGVGSRSGRDRREIPVFFISVGVGGKMRVRGRDHEEFFVTDVSDPDDTPEDVDDDDEPELFLSCRRGMTGEFSLDLQGLSATGGERLCDANCVSKLNLLMSGSLSIRLMVAPFFFVYLSSILSTLHDL